MVDSVQVWPPGTRFIDSSGNVLAGGSIEFYDAGTTDEKTVYSDSGLSTSLGAVVYLDAGGAPVSEQGGSTKVAVYVGTDAYKVVIKDSSGVVIETKDEIQGAFNSASILETLTLIPETEVETLTGAETLTADDAGQLKNCNSTGGAFAVTLPDATSLSNGARFGFRMAGTANSVTVKTTGSQTIARAGVTSTSVALSRLGETLWVVNDGGNWITDTYVPPLHNAVGVIAIADRAATPPGSPTAGARYIMTSGPTGAWSSYAEHDVVEADGNGGWFRYTPAEDCGWIAYVADENAFYYHRGTAWVAEAASETVAGIIEIATNPEVVTGTDTARALTPANVRYDLGVAKVLGNITWSGGTPTLQSGSRNVTGITDTAEGRVTITIDNDFANTNYIVTAIVESNSTTSPRLISITQSSKAVGSFELCTSNSGGNLNDPTSLSFACFGVLA